MKGAREMAAKIGQIAKEHALRVESALYVEAQKIMTASKQLCPVAKDGGTLRASGYVDKPIRIGDRVSVEMGYGGAASAYAIAVHETISEHDPPSWKTMYENGKMIQWTSSGTGDHFLQRPLDEWSAEGAEALADRVRLDK